MFLSSVQPSISQYDFTVGHGITCERTAVEVELSYLAGFRGEDVSVDMVGHYVVLEGTVPSPADAERALNVARGIVGSDRVMSRLVVIHDSRPTKLL